MTVQSNFHRLGDVDNTSSEDQSENALSYKNRDDSSMTQSLWTLQQAGQTQGCDDK